MAFPDYGLILFDLDGTLIDSRKDIAIAANAGLRAAGLPELSEDVISGYVGSGAIQLIERALGRSLGQDADRDLVTRVHASFKEHYRDHCLDNTRLFPGVRNGLFRLKRRYRLGIFTNKTRVFTEPVLRGLHLDRFFDVVLCGDSDVRRKPDPDGFFVASKRTGIGLKRILYVGDSRVDAEAAKNARVDLALVTYGFESTHALQEAKAIGRFKSFEALIRELQKGQMTSPTKS